MTYRRLLDVEPDPLFAVGVEHKMDMGMSVIGMQDEGVPVLTPKFL